MVTGEVGGAPGMMGAGEARGGGKSTTGVAAGGTELDRSNGSTGGRFTLSKLSYETTP